MEKASAIFVELMSSKNFILLFWGFFIMLNMFWESIRLRSKILSEEDLVEIDPKFKGIKSEYVAFSFFWLSILLFSLMVIFPRLDSWAMKTYGKRFDAMLMSVFFFSGYGIYQGAFALLKGVYPIRTMLAFRYDDEKIISRVAKEHIIFSLILFVSSILLFFIFAQF